MIAERFSGEPAKLFQQSGAVTQRQDGKLSDGTSRKNQPHDELSLTETVVSKPRLACP